MLELFITSKVRRKLVVIFTKYPDIKMHVRGLAKMTHEDPGNIQRELLRLEKIGFVKSDKHLNTKVYKVDPSFALYRELQSLVLKSQAHQRTISQN